MALAVGALVVGLLVFFVARGSGSKAPPAVKSGDAAPDLEGLRNRTADPGRTLIQRAKGTTIQWADKADPSRKAGELSYDSLEPLEGQRYNVVRPRIRVFRVDGREWDVRADKGNLYIPDSGAGALGGGAGQSVESGTLSGSVTAKLYREAETEPGGGSEAGDARTAVLTLVTDTFEFDGETYEMDAPGKVKIFGEGIDSEVNGVTLLFSEVKQRIELLKTRGGGWAKLTPADEKEEKPAEKPAVVKGGATPGAAPATPAGDAGKKGAEAPAPVDTWYRAVLSDGVVLEQDGRKLEAQTATALAHVIDGAFKPGAFGDQSGAKAPKAPAGGGADAKEASAGAAAPTTGGPATGAGKTETAKAAGSKADGSKTADASQGADKPVVLTWNGPLELRPVEEKPGLLAQDEMAVRFERPGGVVTMTDTAGKAAGTARIVDYFATRREARLTGNGDAAAVVAGNALADAARWGVNLTAVDAGTLKSNDLAVNLDTGIAVVQGAAEIEGLSGAALTGGAKTDAKGAAGDAAKVDAKPADAKGGDGKAGGAKARIAWTDRGEFHFARDAAGKVTSALDEAYLYGGVLATDGQGELRGEVLRAVFEPSEGGEGAGAKDEKGSSVRLSSLLVERGVKGLDGKGGELTADQLDVGFERTAAGKTEPKLVVATGHVKGSRRTSDEKDAPVQTLEAASLTATLADNAKGSRELDEVKARGAVKFADGTGVHADADELDGRMREEHVTLRGRDAVVSKVEAASAKAADVKDEGKILVADGASVRGRVIEIDGKARTLVVPVAGRFDHRETKLGVTKVAWAEWDREMKLDDAAGTLVAVGSARAESQPDAFTVEKLAGERVEMTMTPDGDGKGLLTEAGAKDAAPVPGAAKPERQILTASVFGADGAPALVESRRYTTPVTAAPAPQEPAAARTLERLFYLESARIDADNTKGLITVPGEGKLLFADRRAPEPAAGAGAKTETPSGFQGQVARGDALFLWKGSLVAERELNRVTFERSVRVVHLRPGDARPTEIEGERLVAELRPAASSEAAASPADLGVGELKSAAVKGAVWARSSEGKELVGDSIFYDALAGTVDAMAEAGNEVTLFDPTSGVPVRARSILLDLTKNSFTVKQPGAITVPK
jgi:hypothetical protein